MLFIIGVELFNHISRMTKREKGQLLILAECGLPGSNVKHQWASSNKKFNSTTN